MLPSPPDQYPELMHHILNMVNSAVLVLDADKRIIFANSRAAQLFNCGVAELKNLDIDQLFMPEDLEIMVPNILKITRDASEYEGETMLKRQDGSSFLGLIFTSSLAWKNGRGIVLTIHDISNLKKLERMLKVSGRVAFLGHLLEDINHQIRNPVQVIGGIAKRLADRQTPRVEHVQAIVSASARLEKLLDTLNFFIKLPRPRLRPVLLHEVFETVVPSLTALARQHGVDWTVEADDNLLQESVFIDTELLAKALHEGMANACEAYDDKHHEKTVQFRLMTTQRPDQPYALQICDRGPGISAQDMPLVFSPFFSRKSKHLGMGLTIAQRIQEEMDCDLLLESSGKTGTCLTYCLVKERRRMIRLRKMPD
ncbi:MAG: hypothetical protein A2521_07885 [Deltaproteobacteria bacterium RIFOXYD12_FULL_57_12]|nr:MAG: hypothetical protein A2521_07885 [Deltaproteobacteria bacterium RIFOXYD12_FULL_57_12]